MKIVLKENKLIKGNSFQGDVTVSSSGVFEIDLNPLVNLLKDTFEGVQF